MSFSARFGRVRSHETFLRAALLAAHGASERARGFRPSDVRFFFLLFTNWIEHDVLHPEQDIDLTQVSRVLVRLCSHGWMTSPPAPTRRRPLPRSRRYVLTSAGLVGLVDGLTALVRAPSFEETLLIVCFCVSYGNAIIARCQGEKPALPKAVRRQLEERLDPRRTLAVARQRLAAVEVDLAARIAESRTLEHVGREGYKAGVSDGELARQLEAAGAYQLHRIRSLTALLSSLPDDLRQFELRDGVSTRRRLLFEPLLHQVRAQRRLLDELGATLASR